MIIRKLNEEEYSEALERRELQRGNRNIGQAKGQLSNMNFNDIYDI